MTDENTRLPSDSVVEALKEARAIAHTASKGITMQRDWLLEKRDQFDATLQALADHPRDDVRREYGCGHSSLAPTVIPSIDTALSQGDEQPETQDDAFVCANCKGLLGELADGREPEELCETCYDHSQESTQPDTDGLAGELERIMRADPMDPDNLPASDETIELDWRLCDCILAALRNDRKAVLEEEVARQEAYERGWIDCTESMTEATHRDGLTEGFAQYQADLRALAEGAGK